MACEIDTAEDAATRKAKKRAYQKVWAAANRDKMRGYDKTWREANAEKIRLRQRVWENKNRQRVRTKGRAAHARNSGKVSARKKARYAANPEHYAAKLREWRASNPGKFTAQIAARRAGLKRATPIWVDRVAIREIYERAAELSMHVDHIHPLKGKNFCGLHVPWNLQLMTAIENSRKGNKLLPEHA